VAKVLVIYATKTKTPRRWVYASPGEDEAQVLHQGHIGPGETGFMVDHSQPHKMHHGEVLEHVARHAGTDPASISITRCAIVHPESGDIVDIIHADHELDTPPLHYILIPVRDNDR